MSEISDESKDSRSPLRDGLLVMDKVPRQMILIKLIGQEEAIYNHYHEDYRNFLKKDDMWRKIAETVGWPEQKCKAKWKAMRDQYCRELKRAQKNSNARIKWKYFPHMKFLRPHALHRRYRYKLPTMPQSEAQPQQVEAPPGEDMPSTNEQLCPSVEVKSELWHNNSNPSTMSDGTTQFSFELEQNPGNEELQEDEDDDPIHTFLNIESYFEEELISMIKAEEVLYNNQHCAYRNIQLKMQIWAEIARKLKRTVRQCRTKWKALRDQYIREHKRLSYSNNDPQLQRWKHYEALTFLEKYIRQRSDGDGTMESIDQPVPILLTNNLNQEQLVTPSAEQHHERTAYIPDDNGASQIYLASHYSVSSGDAEQNDDEGTIEFSAEGEFKDDDDEIGVFFRAVAMKIRNAKMPAVAFTELQIDILRVITEALREKV